MMINIKLLPCPFCGAEAQFRRFGVGDENILVECTNPYGACCRISMGYTPESEKILADEWNKRTKPMPYKWDNYHAIITIPATDCNFISAFGYASNDELTKAEEYLRTHPFANKTRLKAVQREIKGRAKKE